MKGAGPFLYDAAKVASAASHGIDSVRGRALALTARSKQANDDTQITRGIGIRVERRARELLRGSGLKEPPYQRSTFVAALAITSVTRFSIGNAATAGIKLSLNVNGATGHHARRADQFVRQRQRHHHRGINSHGLYSPSQPQGSGILAPPTLP